MGVETAIWWLFPVLALVVSVGTAAAIGTMAWLRVRDLEAALRKGESRWVSVLLRLQQHNRRLNTHSEHLLVLDEGVIERDTSMEQFRAVVTTIEGRIHPHEHHWHAVKHEELHDGSGTHLWTYTCRDCKLKEVHEGRDGQ